MPRPENGSVTLVADTKNPFKRWSEKRKAKQQSAIESAAQQLTADTSANELKMITALKNVDFFNSKLPEDVKNRKTAKEGQRFSDLELAARWMANHLQEHPQTIDADIRGLDKRILALIGYFDGAVKDGNAMTAEYSKTCLMKAVDIRSRVSTQKPESVKHFVEVNEDYLDTWMTVLETAKKIDEEEKENKKLEKRVRDSQEKEEKEKKQLLADVDADPVLADAYSKILSHDSPEDRAKWSQKISDLYRKIIELALMKTRVRFQTMMLDTSLRNQKAIEETLEILYSGVLKVPVPTDEYLLQKQAEALAGIKKSIIVQDKEIERIMNDFASLDGWMDQMNTSPGTLAAARVMEKYVKELEDERAAANVQVEGFGAKRLKRYRDQLDFEKQEEVQEEIQREEEKNRELLQIYEENRVEQVNEESNLQYNE